MSYVPKPIDLLIPLNMIPEAIENIKLFDKKWLTHHFYNDELNLFHYTTSDGLKGILENQTMRCSHFHYFDDPAEWKYGEIIVTSKIDSIMEKEKESKIYNLLDTVKTFIKSISSNLYDIYLACFCASDNLPSQWRRYSNKGGGYCLGFQFDSATNFTYDIDKIPNLKLAGLRKVIYDFKLQNELIDFALSKLIETAELIINQPSRSEYKSDPSIFSQIAMYFANRLVETIISMKSHVYEKEQEWRLIIFKSSFTASDIPKEVEFREKNGELIPYIPVKIYNDENGKSFPIKSIRIGPGLDEEKARHVTKLLKDKQVYLSSQKYAVMDKNIKII